MSFIVFGLKPPYLKHVQFLSVLQCITLHLFIPINYTHTITTDTDPPPNYYFPTFTFCTITSTSITTLCVFSV